MLILKTGEAVLFDHQDRDLILSYHWSAKRNRNNVYAVTFIPAREGNKGHSSLLFMHTLIMNPPSGKEVDHWNGGGLDNRRANLRVVTHQQNMQNMRKSHPPRVASIAVGEVHYQGRDPLMGVVKKPKMERYRAVAHKDYKQYFLGSYDTELEAAIAHDRAMLYLVGPEARLNHPELHSIPASPEQLQRESGMTRRATRASKYKGVYPSGDKWMAMTYLNQESQYIGRFDTETEAAIFFDAVMRFHGCPAHRLNFPDVNTPPMSLEAAKAAAKAKVALVPEVVQ